MDSWCVAVGPGFRPWWAEMACDWCHGACDSPRCPFGTPWRWQRQAEQAAWVPTGCRLAGGPRGAFHPCRRARQNPHNVGPSCASSDLGNCLGVLLRDGVARHHSANSRWSFETFSTRHRPPTADRPSSDCNRDIDQRSANRQGLPDIGANSRPSSTTCSAFFPLPFYPSTRPVVLVILHSSGCCPRARAPDRCRAAMDPLAVPSARARCRHKLSDLIAHPDSSAQPEQSPQPKVRDGQPTAVPAIPQRLPTWYSLLTHRSAWGRPGPKDSEKTPQKLQARGSRLRQAIALDNIMVPPRQSRIGVRIWELRELGYCSVLTTCVVV